MPGIPAIPDRVLSLTRRHRMAQPLRVPAWAGAQVIEFLRRKWNRELDYRLKKTLWAFTGNGYRCPLRV
jgi:nuclear transport factor 2 (NTF2) superfamily protein